MAPKKEIPAFTFYMLFSSMVIFVILSHYGNEGFSLFINNLHQPILDLFFKHITHLGDGMMLLLFIPIIIFKKSIHGLILSLGALVHFVVILLGKQVLFHGAPRPMLHFNEISLHVVEGVKIAYYNTFPSGHTATAFLIVALLAQIKVKNPFYQFFLFVLAFLVAISRVYLMQHFLLDVWAGMWIGYASYTIAKSIVLKFSPAWLNFRLNQFLYDKFLFVFVLLRRRIQSENYRYRRFK